MDPSVLKQQIRFGIEQLSARSGHHEFEELCRALASARIASNIFPATGPVAAGGDGGRDFQTFRTYLADALGPARSFTALASGDFLAFACTLQKKGLPTKIRSDLRKIAVGPNVDRVYAMVGADVTAAKAIELKQESFEAHGIVLEILDAQALAELLAAHDTYWMAARWLALPLEYAPTPPDGGDALPAWYVTSRDRWRAAEHPVVTVGDLIDVRAGLRRSTYNVDERVDLPMWLARVRETCEPTVPAPVRQRARYELVVAQVQAVGDLRPADAEVHRYVNEADAATAGWGELLDLGVLLQFVAAAALAGQTTITPRWWRSKARISEPMCVSGYGTEP